MNLLNNNMYQQFINKKLPLSDQLAAATTILSNERTFLSYQRTALTFLVAGITFVKLFENDTLLYFLGWAFIPIALISLIIGITRYIKMRDLIKIFETDTFELLEENAEHTGK